MDVVVPFAGTEVELRALLDRLAPLRLDVSDTLTVADNRRDGPAVEWDEPQRRVLAVRDAAGSYHARNRAAAEGDGRWLLFLDADVEVPAEIVDLYFAAPAGDRVAVLAGAILDQPEGDVEGAVARFLARSESMSQANTLAGAWSYAQTANCAVLREAFESIGGFRAELRSGGDADLCFRLRRAGWSFEPRPGAAVVHRNRASLRALVRQRARHGSGAAWLNREYPGSFPRRPWLGLARWSLMRLGHAAGRLAAADRAGAAEAGIDPISSWAFELGRLVPNRIDSRR
ncbi:MAG: mycofactocin glycosyltransferase [Solirubrobacterales bacterium]|nr:mycofactocin glycosyltransferase [Solirubrobacterales bacterium]